MAGLQVRPPAMLFDLDGTLINSVYQHVLAWQEALTSAGIELSIWRLHRRVGMSGGLFVTALLRETGGTLSSDQIGELNQAHTEAYARRRDTVRPLPGARELLATLTERR
jgi:beta-phosphoglucomutase-like phosphatase (HAD superfamily)